MSGTDLCGSVIGNKPDMTVDSSCNKIIGYLCTLLISQLTTLLHGIYLLTYLYACTLLELAIIIDGDSP